MPMVQVIYSPLFDEMVSGDSAFVRELTGSQLSVVEWPTDETHISLILLQTASSHQIGDVELMIFAHAFDERVARKDHICGSIRETLEARWQLQVRVWLHLGAVGYGRKDYNAMDS